MSALFGDAAGRYDNNMVGVAYSGQLVGDDDSRPALRGPVEGFLDYTFGVGVKRTGRFIQQEDFGIRYEAAGDGNPLFLPAREQASPLSDPGIVSLWKADNEVMSEGLPGGVLDASLLLVVRGCLPGCPD